jgi:hypothetical protein
MTNKPYASIVAAWEECLRLHGDSAPGVGWLRNDADLRYQVMVELLRSTSDVTLLDFGCGASYFYEFIRRQGLEGIRYSGLDVCGATGSRMTVRWCRNLKNALLPFRT